MALNPQCSDIEEKRLGSYLAPKLPKAECKRNNKDLRDKKGSVWEYGQNSSKGIYNG